jgi:N-formylglutamate deformylase
MAQVHAHEVFVCSQGERALLMSVPHLGTEIVADIAARLAPQAATSPDTDFHLDRLYDFAGALRVSRLQARYSRYVIDLNRPPNDSDLYPGADSTGLVPVDTFAGEALYRNALPDNEEIGARLQKYWQPYHTALADELARLRAEFGTVVLFDCHSIRSRVPRFFDGQLPDFNLGTANGTSCAPELRALLSRTLDVPEFTLAVDGRFKGGYITRHYGAPGDGVHAFQLELSQATYMHENASNAFDETRAAQVRPCLRRMLEAALQWVEGR